MKVLKKTLAALVAAVAVLLLAACGEQTFTAAQVQQAKDKAAAAAAATAASSASAAEAAKADAKLIAARTEMSQFGKDVARKGSYLLTKNCEVKPDGFAASKAAANFPSTAFGMYKEACSAEVVAMKHERSLVAAKAKANEQKLAAAKKAKAEKLAATKAKHPKSTGYKPQAKG